MMAIREPENVRTVAVVLGDRSYKTTQKYYNLALELHAVGQLHDSIGALLAHDETPP